ncbi:agmatinase [Mangrovicoccus algicola]|uniref:Agmatinase n=1 Tax=Mangrovicoccus algicola TaxID=2771008 RepID=A0A8J7D0U9_9RHOB|nr:agmatinase [Mangrovicoccus algicola]MBE3639988.1 agmatinase [Mangrovicoccus algicola]
MIFLDGELSADERDDATARFRVIPVPLERTVSYGSGTAGGPAAILEASVELERLWRGAEPCSAGIATEEPVACDGPLPEVMARIEARTRRAVAAGAVPVVLGGEHSLSYGAVRGVAAATGEALGIVQIDAHADLRHAYQGERHSHASVMRLLAEEDGLRLAQYGVRALCAEEAEARKRLGVVHSDGEALARGEDPVLPRDFPRKIYVSFDVDGLDPSVMPDTGTPVPGGLGFWQAIHLLERVCAGRQIVGIDVVELAPQDGSRVSDFTAAQICYALMGLERQFAES